MSGGSNRGARAQSARPSRRRKYFFSGATHFSLAVHFLSRLFNLTTLGYETPIANPFSGTNGIFCGGGWAPGMIPEPASLGLAMLAAVALKRRR